MKETAEYLMETHSIERGLHSREAIEWGDYTIDGRGIVRSGDSVVRRLYKSGTV